MVSVDDVQALARSSPWLWRRIHLRARGMSWGDVEAWIDRPARMAVRDGDELSRRDHEVGAGMARGWSLVEDGTDVADVSPPVETEAVWIGDLPAERRADGLVRTRPDGRREDERPGPLVDEDDPMWQNYSWVAMLDPDELSHDVTITDVEEIEVRGRLTWAATMTPVEDYQPRCSCCALLWGEVAAGQMTFPDPEPGAPTPQLPTAHRVGIDRQTGVVTTLRPLGGDTTGAFEVEIAAVDGDVEPMLDAAARAEADRPPPTGTGWTAYRP